MDFLPEKIDQYANDLTTPDSELLQSLERETHLKVLSPRMLSGHLQGRVLSLISHLMRPNYILEIGTYTGYSAICLAEGLHPNGRLITIDRNDELETILSKYLLKSPKASQIDLRIGYAAEIIPTLPDGIDLVFIDADKPNYATYFDLVIDKMKPGGLILADNVLWSGKIVEEIKPNDKSTKALHEFNLKVHHDSRVENVLIPIRDGILAIRKL
jgi:predicted O-methyltransferase YrrM